MSTYTCEISGNQVTFCEESKEQLSESFDWKLDPETKRPASILVTAETEVEAKEKAQKQLEKDYPANEI